MDTGGIYRLVSIPYRYSQYRYLAGYQFFVFTHQVHVDCGYRYSFVYQILKRNIRLDIYLNMLNILCCFRK
jgi:hypothetical protein